MYIPENVVEKITDLSHQIWEAVQGIEAIAPWEYPWNPEENGGPAFLCLYVWPDSVDFRLTHHGEYLLNVASKYNKQTEEWEEMEGLE